MEPNSNKQPVIRLTAKALGLDEDVRHDEMVRRLRRVRSALSPADVRRMFVRREEDEFFFSVGYYLLTPGERGGENARTDAVWRGYLAVRYLDTAGPGEGRTPFELYRGDVAGDIDRFCGHFRAILNFRICSKCFESRPRKHYRLTGSTVCMLCQTK